MPTISNPPDDHRLITEARAREIYEVIRGFQQGDGYLIVNINAWWCGELRWARNRVTAASDRRNVQVYIGRVNRLGAGTVLTNQIDSDSLAAAVRAAERKMLLGDSIFRTQPDGLRWNVPLLPLPDTTIWSDATYNVTPRQRSVLAQALADGAESQQLLSSGFLQMRVGESIGFGTDFRWLPIESQDDSRREGTGAHRVARDAGYQRHTESQCSMTVRHPKGMGSGWAGLSSYDWSAIDAGALAQRALDKCVASLNPVAIEPGRYTAILEPQAVAQFTDLLVGQFMDRMGQEEPGSPGLFSLGVDPVSGLRLTRLGLKIVDERISISHDPMDPRLGTVPGLGLGPVTWVEHGVLKTLGYDRGVSDSNYSLPILNDNLPVLSRGSYSMTGGTATLGEMIASTRRGVVVSRFSGASPVPNAEGSLLFSGLTRDGLWLVENGKISRAIKNMRFTDSPLFVLNQIEMLGVPVPVFSPGDEALRPTIVPPLKVNDFAFTAMVDAV